MPTCCSAAWLSFPTKRQQQLSAVQADPPGFLVRRLVIPGILARCPLWKKVVDSWRSEDFNGAFVCDVFLQCCVFAEKMPAFNDVSGDRASNRRPLKFQVLSIAIGPHHLFIL